MFFLFFSVEMFAQRSLNYLISAKEKHLLLMKLFRVHNGKYVQWITYHDNKILIGCNDRKCAWNVLYAA